MARNLTQAVSRRWSDQKYVYFGKSKRRILDLLKSDLSEVVDSDSSRVEALQSSYPSTAFTVAEDFNPDGVSLEGKTVLIGNILSELADIWSFLRKLRNQSSENTRLCLIQANYLWQPIFRSLAKFRCHSHGKKPSWLSPMDIENLLRLNGFEMVSSEDRILFPFSIPGLSWFFNRFLLSLPLFRRLAFFRLYFVRQNPSWSLIENNSTRPSVSIVVPCRNEKGTFKDASTRCLILAYPRRFSLSKGVAQIIRPKKLNGSFKSTKVP